MESAKNREMDYFHAFREGWRKESMPINGRGTTRGMGGMGMNQPGRGPENVLKKTQPGKGHKNL